MRVSLPCTRLCAILDLLQAFWAMTWDELGAGAVERKEVPFHAMPKIFMTFLKSIYDHFTFIPIKERVAQGSNYNKDSLNSRIKLYCLLQSQ